MQRAFGVAAVVLFGASLAPRARAIDPFEIQVYDGTANAPGQAGLELHVNDVARGQTTAEPPELPQNRQTHFTLEPSYGVTDFWELGGYLQSTLREDGHFDYAGVKLRSKLVTPPWWSEHWRFGLNFELSLLPQAYDRDRWGMELRPIATWENEQWLFVVNPIVDASLAGPDWPAGPTLQPAAWAMYKIYETIGFGFEYYADFGPVAKPLPWSQEQHYLYEVESLLSVKNLELQIGVGEGLTHASNALVLKTIVGYVF